LNDENFGISSENVKEFKLLKKLNNQTMMKNVIGNLPIDVFFLSSSFSWLQKKLGWISEWN